MAKRKSEANKSRQEFDELKEAGIQPDKAIKAINAGLELNKLLKNIPLVSPPDSAVENIMKYAGRGERRTKYHPPSTK